MAAPLEEESLESTINKATNPCNKDLDWENIRAFCELLNKDFEGPQLATRLLAHKIQSPQEWEAVQALSVLETCMKTCGQRFHMEVGKFRFLNELIKVVSPKYLGSRTPEKVKTKVLELMYGWTLGLPDELKIAEAYQMLKKQGIIKQDPVLPPDKPFLLLPPRPKNAMFEDEEKSKMLARLLKSTHPEDLRAANKLIKEMVQEDQKRMEKISKRVNAIEEVNNNVKLLTEMLTNYRGQETSESNSEIMKELYQRCEKMRPTLFRLASDTEDNDEALAEILQANDNLTLVINLYKQVVKGEETSEDSAMPTIKGKPSALLDLTGLDASPVAPSYPAFPALSSQSAPPQGPGAAVSLLDDELMSLGLNDPTSSPVAASAASQPTDSSGWNAFQSSDTTEAAASPSPAVATAATSLTSEVLKPTSGRPNPVPGSSSSSPAVSQGSKALDDLDLLGKTLIQQSLPPESQQVKWEKQQPKLSLRDLQSKSNPGNAPAVTGISPLLHSGTRTVSPARPGAAATTEQPASLPYTSPAPSSLPGAALLGKPGASQSGPGPTPSSVPPLEISLANVVVPLESIKPIVSQ
ncbi:ADP-ribosylation factor-binding protein GGA1 isoform X2 [Latimeria chalumnae]|uniref:ADP-ribosylation factor-binding protein GGA1 isoform X2 n=1 Tax=Latimeria chalumnae TaxID=7897 RepID=UPI00313B69F4